MCKWKDIIIIQAKGKRRIPIKATVMQHACSIIHTEAELGRTIAYTNIMNCLKNQGHKKIYRGTIGNIVGEVSNQVSQITNPSIYPSAIVVRKGTKQAGPGFWNLHRGTAPPNSVTKNHRRKQMNQYQQDVFMFDWDCNC
ncbi:hypothetical protein ACFLTP_06670 [Chloroflexota bacterium]